ncbi:MAG: DUF86 domain-containing protein [Acidimicrobiaceae bacterium]|nr:DUF86 domain-containing protein [Acidimicrobiaceae bacterium]
MRDDDLIAAILGAANELNEIRNRGRTAFETDPVNRRACERLVEIIGDMVGSFSVEFQQAHPELRYRDAKGMRNLLAHHYLKVRQDRVWDVVDNVVPMISERLREIASDRAVDNTEPGLNLE